MKSAHILTMLLIVVFFTTTLAAQIPETKSVEVYGQKIAYYEAGTGPAVILLHGLGANKKQWVFAMPALAASHRVIAIDQLGSGDSAKPMINYRIGTLVDFLSEFMRKVNVDKASLVGSSMGGWVAALFAVTHPEQTDKLVLSDAAGYFVRAVSRDEMAYLNPSTLAGTRALLTRVLANKALVTDKLVENLFIERMQSGDSYVIERFTDSVMRHEDYLNDQLKNVKAPTLLIWGRDDEIVPVVLADTFEKQIAGSRKVVLDKCGHAPHLECALAFNDAVVQFLKP